MATSMNLPSDFEMLGRRNVPRVSVYISAWQVRLNKPALGLLPTDCRVVVAYNKKRAAIAIVPNDRYGSVKKHVTEDGAVVLSAKAVVQQMEQDGLLKTEGATHSARVEPIEGGGLTVYF
jgi:hypothetical protein